MATISFVPIDMRIQKPLRLVTMLVLQLLVLLVGAIVGASETPEDLNFPPGFKFGVATAAYQIEGAWNVSDKSESIWDRFTHTHPEYIRDGSTGDVACDSYNNWRRDVEMVAELGVHFYRFSISWPRLLPHGIASYISDDGRQYYSDLIDGLLEKGIEPIVTLYHFDLPQKLQDLGGWTNPLVADWFADYARVVYSLYGDRVKTWITINEPIIMCDYAYNFGFFAPGVSDEDIAPYLCNKHVLMAHAKAYRIYDNEFRMKYQGQVSIAIQLMWAEPLNEEDEDLTELVRIKMALSVHPIFSQEGGWSLSLEKIMADISRRMGFPHNRLPQFSREEIKLVQGTYDFFGLNFYASRLVRKVRPGETYRAWPTDSRDLGAIVEYHPNWNHTSVIWLYVYPEGLRKQLVWLKKQYGDLNFRIMENGFPSLKGLNDVDRINNHREYLRQILLAINEDRINITAYTIWSLMDNFEWSEGYVINFGLYEVDASPARKRTARASARYYASVIAAHSLDVPVVTFEEVVLEVHKPKWGSLFTTWQGWVIILAIVALTAAVIAAAVVYTRRRRTRAAAGTQRPTYVTVKTDGC